MKFDAKANESKIFGNWPPGLHGLTIIGEKS